MITVNAMGDNCPIPVIKTKKAMQALTGPETIEVLVDNEIAVQNVTKMAAAQGGEVSSEKLGEKEFRLRSRCREHRQAQRLKKLSAHRTERATRSWLFLLTVWDPAMTNLEKY